MFIGLHEIGAEFVPEPEVAVPVATNRLYVEVGARQQALVADRWVDWWLGRVVVVILMVGLNRQSELVVRVVQRDASVPAERVGLAPHHTAGATLPLPP